MFGNFTNGLESTVQSPSFQPLSERSKMTQELGYDLETWMSKLPTVLDHESGSFHEPEWATKAKTDPSISLLLCEDVHQPTFFHKHGLPNHFSKWNFAFQLLRTR